MIPSLEKLIDHCYSALHIDLYQLRKNYQALRSLMQGGECAAVLKANAYGMNVTYLVPVLLEEGCKTFFVAYLDEAIQLRSLIPAPYPIYVLNDLYPGLEEQYLAHSLIPVLTDKSKVALWQAYAAQEGRTLPAALHFDTGMTRSGIPQSQYDEVLNNLDGLDLKVIISHLACADEAENPFNAFQLELFLQLCQHFPKIPKSFANSAGMLLGPEYRFDIGRPGIGLHGLGLHPWAPDEMKCIVSVYARIYQIQPLQTGQSVGYNQTYISKKEGRTATLSLGYADGYSRHLSNQGMVQIGDFTAPVLGRVSMDLLCIDVTDIPESQIYPGQWVEVMGPRISPTQLIQKAGMSPYELLLNLGNRLKRIYTDEIC